MIRLAIAVFLAVHGIAHGVGFAAPWQIGGFGDTPVDTTLLGGRIDFGVAGARIVGIGWLLIGLTFLIAAGAVWKEQRWWVPLATGTAVLSLALCILVWPLAWIGLLVNLAILVMVSSVGRPPVL